MMARHARKMKTMSVLDFHSFDWLPLYCFFPDRLAGSLEHPLSLTKSKDGSDSPVLLCPTSK